MSGVLNLLLAGAASAIKDAYYNLTTLLLNTSSTNGAQNNTFLDSSTNNFTITRNGNTTQGTFTPFSQTGWSNYFNGTGSGPYIRFGSSSALTFGTGDFTIEFWVYFVSVNDGSVSYLYDMRDGGSGSFFVQEPANTFTYINGAGNSVTTGMTSSTFTANQWYHVAICRASGVINFYVNGTKVSSNPADTSNYATTYLSIMSRSASDGANNNANSYTSNFRVVKGTAVYTSNFTPSTTPLTAISGTSLLTCQANRFVDNSGNALTVAVDSSLTPSVQAFSPFAPTAAYDTAVVGGSGYFDGTGDYLTIASNAAFDFGSGDATIEAWIYPTTSGQTCGIFDKRSSGANYSQFPQIALTSGALVILVSYSGSSWAVTINGATPAANAWTHVALVRNGNTWTLYVNGVVSGTPVTASGSVYASTDSLSICAATSGGLNPFVGYISNTRVVKGTAVYTSAFTPPTAPPTAITNTVLLLNATNAGIYDSTAKNVLETVGNVQVSTAKSKWGTTSMGFDGNGDYLSIPNTSLLQLGGSDWTIECWAYINSTTGDQRPISQNNSNYEFAFFMSSGGAMSAASYQSGGSTNFNISMGTLSAGQWYHLAASRSGSTVRAFVNGTLQNSATYSGTIDARTGGWRLGASYVPGDYFNGYLDDVRITLGYARYTANFTAPTAAFPIQ